MRKFIGKLLFFILVLFIIDRAFIIFRRNETNIFSEIARKKMKKISPVFSSQTKYDILIFGSSHAQFAVSPEIISDETGAKSLNVAFGDGANAGKQLAILQYIISQNSGKIPKTILFGIEVFSLNRPPVYSDEFLRILFNENSGVNKFFYSKYSNSYCKLYARFIPQYIDDLRKGEYLPPYFRKGNSYDLSMFSKYSSYNISDLGWVKGYGTLNKKFLRYSNTIFEPDKYALQDLDKFIQICKDNHIKLIFFQTPEHIECLKYKKKYIDFDQFMNKLSKKHELVYINYNNVEKYPLDNDSLFFDTDHLNAEGAAQFTRLLNKELKSKK